MPEKDIAKTGLSTFDSYLETLAEKPATFAVRLTDGRPSLVFRRTFDHDEIKRIREAAIKAVQSVMDGAVIDAWKPYLTDDITVVGRAKHFAERHVGVLQWFDCEEPATPTENHRKIGDKWQEERIVEEKWGELQFMVMAKKDGHGFQALIDGFNDQIGVGWSSADASRFQKSA